MENKQRKLTIDDIGKKFYLDTNLNISGKLKKITKKWVYFKCKENDIYSKSENGLTGFYKDCEFIEKL